MSGFTSVFIHWLIVFAGQGDLKQFLLATRKEGTATKPRPTPLTVPQCVALVRQLALALEHTANHRLVHKDVAARNCLISSNLSLKLSLSALSKDTYSKEYYRHHNQVVIHISDTVKPLKSQPRNKKSWQNVTRFSTN